ncbi:MAG: bifunctional 5,10-methylenetetrahydrofolate dehydrogenase/5,10-methenyltetrahydrofolate cyclohydrolase [Patescibacteria group bacterium]
MATLLNGRALAEQLLQELKLKISALDFTPCLGVILVGDDPASHLYVSLKEKAAAEVGISVNKIILPATATLSQITGAVKTFNENANIHGILVQLPLPAPLPEQTVINSIDPNKDADGFHPLNLKKLTSGQPSIIPGLSEGIIKLINLTGLELKNKAVLILANSEEFSQPLSWLLGQLGLVVKTSLQPEAAELLKADIIIVALGQPEIITGQMVKDGTILIDVGTTKVNNQLKGDIKAADFINRSVYLTPVPGGVGPMTVAMLLWNVYRLATNQNST